jgi:peroxiredoxin
VKHTQHILRRLLCFALLSVTTGVSCYSSTVRRAPDFSCTDLQNHRLQLSTFRGKVVLLNFWATWCVPCLAEMPHFRGWQQEYAKAGLQVIGISMDDEPSPVTSLYRKYQLNYPVAMGDEKLGDLYGGVFGLPVTFLIDRKGRIRYTHQGEADLSRMRQEIQGLLNER